MSLLAIGANAGRAPIHCLVLVDYVQLAAGAEIVLAPTMLRVLSIEGDVRPPVNLLSEDEGVSWCRGWDGDAERALLASVLLR